MEWNPWWSTEKNGEFRVKKSKIPYIAAKKIKKN
jgi:hypothetical protein